MVTGKAFVKFSSDTSRAFFVSLVEESEREALNTVLLGLCATVKVINSQKRRVNVEKLRQLTMETYLALVEGFPWAAVSPSVHRILAHSWEVIQLNDGYGLGGLSEEGLESLNKQIRHTREKGARKDNCFHNFVDTYNHLWDRYQQKETSTIVKYSPLCRSRPTIVEMDREVKQRPPKLTINTEIEYLVDSLFLEEEEE